MEGLRESPSSNDVVVDNEVVPVVDNNVVFRCLVFVEETLSEKQELRWNEIKSFGIHEYCKLHPRIFAKRMARGIPNDIRFYVWSTLLNVRFGENKLRLYEMHEVNENDCSYSTLIKIDIPRTFPELTFFDEAVQQELFLILYSFAIQKPDIGYCQGMNFIAGFILIVAAMKTKEAFDVFVHLMEDFMIEDFFCENFPLLNKYTETFDSIFIHYAPDLYNHFNKEGIIPAMYFHQWFLTLYITCLPLQSVIIIWDKLISSDLTVLMLLAITLLKSLESYLMQKNCEEIVPFLKTLKLPKDKKAALMGRLLIRKMHAVHLPEHLLVNLKKYTQQQKIGKIIKNGRVDAKVLLDTRPFLYKYFNFN